MEGWRGGGMEGWGDGHGERLKWGREGQTQREGDRERCNMKGYETGGEGL